MDKIFITNIPTQAVVGINDFEKVKPQKLIISVELGTNIHLAAENDDIQLTLDYDKISSFIDHYVQNTSFELIETIAERLTTALFAEFNIKSILLRLQKPSAIGYTQMVGVEIYRERPI